MKRTLIERVEIVTSDRNAAITDLTAEGYRIISSGPYTDAEMFPSVDVTRQQIVAERVAESVLKNGAELEACLFGFAELHSDPDAKRAIAEWRNTERLYA